MENNITIDELDLKVRSYVFLKRNELFTLPDICKKLDKGIEELMKTPRITVKVSINILNAVKPYGYPSEKLVDEYLTAHKNDESITPENLALWEECLQGFALAE